MQTTTNLLQGGLDLVTPPVAMPAGRVTAAINYEPEVSGYKRIVGYERFDGQDAPSEAGTPAEATSRRDAITAVPGSGDILGLHVYAGALWAFRDTEGGAGAMYKATSIGWTQQTFTNFEMPFENGSAEFLPDEVVTGGTSGATASIKRVILQGGAWGTADAYGYLVVSGVVGTFQDEAATSASGSADIRLPVLVALSSGGRYDCLTHNFYGTTYGSRMYFANGEGSAFEWDGTVLAPIRSGNANGAIEELQVITDDSGATITDDFGEPIWVDGNFDRPTHIDEFRNHLFLGFRAGSIIHSGIGEPLDYRSIAGALEWGFGEMVTGFIGGTSGAMIVTGERQIQYFSGTDADNFTMTQISDNAGGKSWTAQLFGDTPMFLDESGLRRLDATDTFGNWRTGTITQMIEPLIRAKKAAGVTPAASMIVRERDQYWLFFNDQTGIIVYLGREAPECMPFKLPIQVTCATVGTLSESEGERFFVGATNGYVYEIGKGNSFDGAEVQAFLRLAWMNLGGPAQEKKFHKVTIEGDFPESCDIGITYAVDYGMPGNPGGTQDDITASAGSASLIDLDFYDNIDWTQPAQWMVESHLFGVGVNCAVTLISEHTDEARHTLSASTLHFSPRRLRR